MFLIKLYRDNIYWDPISRLDLSALLVMSIFIILIPVFVISGSIALYEVEKIYNSIKDFITNDYVAYCKCLNNKWLDDACIHMMNRIKKNEKGYWTKEHCQEESLKYNTPSTAYTP